VNPVLFRVNHSRATTGSRAHRPSLVESAGKRTITEGLGSVAAPSWIPLIYDHLDWHLASPDATPALLLEGSRGKSPMTALAVYRKRRRGNSRGSLPTLPRTFRE